jgi:predicted GTPase
MVENVIIMGAAGRDFHNFNVYFKDNERYCVKGFTATQIPDIDGRCYPPMLAGRLYPDGIPIYADNKLADLIEKHRIDLVAFSYSDVTHLEVMHKASIVTAAGADFIMIGASYTMLPSTKKIVSVCAVRTGCGKSQTSRKVVGIIQDMGKKVVSVRHPMPYGDLTKQVLQRFSSYEDFETYGCTIEEREEYEPVIAMGAVVYAGIDYEKILRQAETEADVIVWDGGNNDTPFFKPDVHIVIFDPHRAGHETTYHPGETNMLMADIAIINKVDSARQENIEQLKQTIQHYNPRATIITAESLVKPEDPDAIKGKRVMVIEDGPTLTHGEMAYGAGVLAAKRFHAAEIVDPRPHLKGTLRETYIKYPHMGALLPAMGYSKKQIKDLEETINSIDCDLVLAATPIDLSKIISIKKPVMRIRYEYGDKGSPILEDVLKEKLGA